MIGDKLLGYDGCSSDEIRTAYLLRDGKLIARSECNHNERVVNPAMVAAELDLMTKISLNMAETCAQQGIGAGDYPARVRATEGAAKAIREAFGLAVEPGPAEGR